VAAATTYPGTPSTEIIETLEEFKDRFVHWATNEKAALELAYGAALAGARALTTIKHVGQGQARLSCLPPGPGPESPAQPLLYAS
jgi:TPP-dependent indolepyruvate ferredoxin oxidoreductase alpha subunit